jgi:hypothetical protein
MTDKSAEPGRLSATAHDAASLVSAFRPSSTCYRFRFRFYPQLVGMAPNDRSGPPGPTAAALMHKSVPFCCGRRRAQPFPQRRGQSSNDWLCYTNGWRSAPHGGNRQRSIREHQTARPGCDRRCLEARGVPRAGGAVRGPGLRSGRSVFAHRHGPLRIVGARSLIRPWQELLYGTK